MERGGAGALTYTWAAWRTPASSSLSGCPRLQSQKMECLPVQFEKGISSVCFCLIPSPLDVFAHMHTSKPTHAFMQASANGPWWIDCAREFDAPSITDAEACMEA